MSAKLFGDKDLIRAFKRHGKAAEQAAENALIAGGFEIANEADKNITEKNIIETGNLKRSISPQDSGNPFVENDPEGVKVIVGTEVEYAPFHEYGTSKMGARPYLRPAFDAKQQKAVAIFDKVLRKQLRKL